MLSEKLERKYKVKRDFNLIMHHRAPDNFKELFDQQIQRGSAGPQFDNLFFKKSKVFIFSKYLTKFSINLFNFLTQLYFIYLPEYKRYISKYNNKNYLKIKNTIRNLNIRFIDIHKDVFMKSKNPLEFFPFNKNGHYNEKGYKLIANEIYKVTK